MPLDKKQLAALISNLNPNRVQHRKQGGADMSYLEGWEVKTSLIRMFGFGGFSAEVIDSEVVTIREGETRNDGKPKTPQAIAKATVRLTIFGIADDGRDAVYTETAIGSNSGWDIGETLDNAIKTAETDALKRAATYLGTQFGLSLYRKGSTIDVVGSVLAPAQGTLIAEHREEREKKFEQDKKQMQGKLDKVTGKDSE